jgi:spore germination cell wall hydrolase CwlJ-like protein
MRKGLKLVITATIIVLGVHTGLEANNASNRLTGANNEIIDPITISTIAYEASGSPFQAQVLVAKCIRQRAQERHLTERHVCLEPSQFSCWRKGRPTQSRKLTEKELLTAKRAYEVAKDCHIEVNMYHDTSIRPSWSFSKKVMFVQQIGTLRFYKEIR